MAIIVERERFVFQTTEEFLAYLRAQQEMSAETSKESRIVVNSTAATLPEGMGVTAASRRSEINTKEEPEEGKEWDAHTLRRLWQMIPPQTRRIVSEIARRPLGYSKDELRTALKLEFKDIMGPLSGLRTRTNRAFKGYPPIVQVDYAQYQYTIGDPRDEARSERLAGLILAITERDG